MNEQEQSFGRGICFVLLATVGWSLSGLFVRFMPELSGFQINCWRGFWTSVTILCYLVLVYGSDAVNVFSRIPMMGLLLSAGFFACFSAIPAPFNLWKAVKLTRLADSGDSSRNSRVMCFFGRP